MEEQVKQLVELAGKIQAAAAAKKLQVEARACIIAASNLILAESFTKGGKK